MGTPFHVIVIAKYKIEAGIRVRLEKFTELSFIFIKNCLRDIY